MGAGKKYEMPPTHLPGLDSFSVEATLSRSALRVERSRARWGKLRRERRPRANELRCRDFDGHRSRSRRGDDNRSWCCGDAARRHGAALPRRPRELTAVVPSRTIAVRSINRAADVHDSRHRISSRRCRTRDRVAHCVHRVSRPRDARRSVVHRAQRAAPEQRELQKEQARKHGYGATNNGHEERVDVSPITTDQSSACTSAHVVG